MLTGKIPGGRLCKPIKPGSPQGMTRKQRACLTKAEKRVLEWQERKTSSVAKSAAHEGVVARPMDKNLSQMLAQQRAQKLGRGTSVSRLKKKREEEQEGLLPEMAEPAGGSAVGRLNKSRGETDEDEEEETTSVGRLRQDHLQFAPKLPSKPTKTQYGDLE